MFLSFKLLLYIILYYINNLHEILTQYKNTVFTAMFIYVWKQNRPGPLPRWLVKAYLSVNSLN